MPVEMVAMFSVIEFRVVVGNPCQYVGLARKQGLDAVGRDACRVPVGVSEHLP
jgi:hypothetical protein